VGPQSVSPQAGRIEARSNIVAARNTIDLTIDARFASLKMHFRQEFPSNVQKKAPTKQCSCPAAAATDSKIDRRVQ
jgi:hypothetical protein